MVDKKVRGLKRKTKNMVNRIVQETKVFPSDFYNGYWHLHLPVSQDFISSNKTPFAIKRLCIQTLLDRAEYLVSIKPPALEKLRVVVAIDLPDLWNSQIIVFFLVIVILKGFLKEITTTKSGYPYQWKGIL